MLTEPPVAKQWDRFTLERYCDLLVQYRRAANIVASKGLTHTTTGSQGQEKLEERPEFGQMCKMATLLLKIEQEFGLTPAARARIVVDAPEQKPDNKNRFFARTG